MTSYEFASFFVLGTTVQQWHIDWGDDLLAWTLANRYIRDFTCEERETYRIAPLCE